MRVTVFGLISAHAGRNRGGTAFSIVRLANHLTQRGVEVDVLALATAFEQEVMCELDERVGRIPLKGRRRWSIFGSLLRHLLARQPHAVVAFDTRANSLACLARQIPVAGRPVIASIRNSVEARLGEAGRAAERRRRGLIRILSRADRVVAISNGLAHELIRATGAGHDRLRVIHNLVVGPALLETTADAVDHPWYEAERGSRDYPVILGVGRLEGQKDFPTLIRAFGLLRARRRARLIILGRGSQAGELDRLARELDVRGDVDFPGFVTNPAAWMAGADVFALSSRAEGFGMVLAEAMAVGCPVVSTDCMSGPREILEDGRYGSLVPVGDAAGMADALSTTLDHPATSADLRAGAMRFSIEANGDAFLDLIREVVHV